MVLAFRRQTFRNQVDIVPKVIPQVHDDWFWSTTDYNPLERNVVRRIDLLMRKPCGDKQEVASLRGGVKLTPIAPANVATPAQDVRDRMLLSVVMYSRAGSGLNEEQPSPHRRTDAGLWINCGSTLRSWCLRRGGIELFWANDTN